jgi:signal recognition particle receptor subunit beta
VTNVHEALSISENVPVIECDAREQGSARTALVTLVEHAMATPAATVLVPTPVSVNGHSQDKPG